MADVTVAAPADEPKPEPENNTEKQFAENKKDLEKQPERPKVESEQVKNTQLGLQGGPKPPGSVRGAVDRQAHNQAMAKDDNAVKKENAEQAKLIAQQTRDYKKQFEQASEKEKGQDKDPGMSR